MRLQLIVAAALGLVFVGGAGGRSTESTGGALKLRTLVSVPSRVGIVSFAQDGDRIAWLQAATFECASLKPAKPLRIRSLSTEAQVALPSTQLPCDFGGDLAPRTLALAGQRALWTITRQSNTETDGLFVTAAVNDRAERRACGFAVSGGSEDLYFPTLATAGDGRTLAFTMDGRAVFNASCNGLWLADQRGKARRIAMYRPPSIGPTLIAVGGHRIAAAETIDKGGLLEARSSVDLREAGSGKLLATVATAGRVQAIALSASTLALPVDRRAGRRIELFDPRRQPHEGRSTFLPRPRRNFPPPAQTSSSASATRSTT